MFVPPQAALLIFAAAAVGVLHTLVPDHWVPITVFARQQHWSRAQTARAAFTAGVGHTLSTLAIGVVVWIAGLAVAVRYGHLLSALSSAALIVFGAWIVVASLRELREQHDHGHAHGDTGKPTARMTLLLILGSSPMVEGIPAFFAAAKFGAAVLGVMAVLFAASTIATYVALCLLSRHALHRFSLGPLERYGEVLSGGIIAAVGVVFVVHPM